MWGREGLTKTILYFQEKIRRSNSFISSKYHHTRGLNNKQIHPLQVQIYNINPVTPK